MEASGFIVVGESASAMAYIKGRRGISPRLMKAILFACMAAVGISVGAWASESWFAATVSVEFAFLGLGVGLVIIQTLAAPSLRKALADRGQASEQALTFRLTPDALVYDLAELTMIARWPCVTDLYRTRKYWVFLVQSSAMVLPRRFFATPQAERDFIGAAMSRMSDAARARSPDAAKIVGG
ncbi:YcxB family protein [Sphingomonas sp. RB3P16]|uniref:YcxB family protein n=1 Tax=Parasphingomonas frigoris TaxID=3096163 RepID=UPI002FC9F5BA